MTTTSTTTTTKTATKGGNCYNINDNSNNNNGNTNDDNNFIQCCSCCPYGYHIDVGFLHYLEKSKQDVRIQSPVNSRLQQYQQQQQQLQQQQLQQLLLQRRINNARYFETSRSTDRELTQPNQHQTTTDLRGCSVESCPLENTSRYSAYDNVRDHQHHHHQRFRTTSSHSFVTNPIVDGDVTVVIPDVVDDDKLDEANNKLLRTELFLDPEVERKFRATTKLFIDNGNKNVKRTPRDDVVMATRSHKTSTFVNNGNVVDGNVVKFRKTPPAVPPPPKFKSNKYRSSIALVVEQLEDCLSTSNIDYNKNYDKDVFENAQVTRNQFDDKEEDTKQLSKVQLLCSRIIAKLRKLHYLEEQTKLIPDLNEHILSLTRQLDQLRMKQHFDKMNYNNNIVDNKTATLATNGSSNGNGNKARSQRINTRDIGVGNAVVFWSKNETSNEEILVGKPECRDVCVQMSDHDTSSDVDHEGKHELESESGTDKKITSQEEENKLMKKSDVKSNLCCKHCGHSEIVEIIGDNDLDSGKKLLKSELKVDRNIAKSPIIVTKDDDKDVEMNKKNVFQTTFKMNLNQESDVIVDKPEAKSPQNIAGKPQIGAKKIPPAVAPKPKKVNQKSSSDPEIINVDGIKPIVAKSSVFGSASVNVEKSSSNNKATILNEKSSAEFGTIFGRNQSNLGIDNQQNYITKTSATLIKENYDGCGNKEFVENSGLSSQPTTIPVTITTIATSTTTTIAKPSTSMTTNVTKTIIEKSLVQPLVVDLLESSSESDISEPLASKNVASVEKNVDSIVCGNSPQSDVTDGLNYEQEMEKQLENNNQLQQQPQQKFQHQEQPTQQIQQHQLKQQVESIHQHHFEPSPQLILISETLIDEKLTQSSPLSTVITTTPKQLTTLTSTTTDAPSTETKTLSTTTATTLSSTTTTLSSTTTTLLTSTATFAKTTLTTLSTSSEQLISEITIEDNVIPTDKATGGDDNDAVGDHGNDTELKHQSREDLNAKEKNVVFIADERVENKIEKQQRCNKLEQTTGKDLSASNQQTELSINKQTSVISNNNNSNNNNMPYNNVSVTTTSNIENNDYDYDNDSDTISSDDNDHKIRQLFVDEMANDIISNVLREIREYKVKKNRLEIVENNSLHISTTASSSSSLPSPPSSSSSSSPVKVIGGREKVNVVDVGADDDEEEEEEDYDDYNDILIDQMRNTLVQIVPSTTTTSSASSTSTSSSSQTTTTTSLPTQFIAPTSSSSATSSSKTTATIAAATTATIAAATTATIAAATTATTRATTATNVLKAATHTPHSSLALLSDYDNTSYHVINVVNDVINDENGIDDENDAAVATNAADYVTVAADKDSNVQRSYKLSSPTNSANDDSLATSSNNSSSNIDVIVGNKKLNLFAETLASDVTLTSDSSEAESWQHDTRQPKPANQLDDRQTFVKSRRFFQQAGKLGAVSDPGDLWKVKSSSSDFVIGADDDDDDEDDDDFDRSGSESFTSGGEIIHAHANGVGCGNGGVCRYVAFGDTLSGESSISSSHYGFASSDFGTDVLTTPSIENFHPGLGGGGGGGGRVIIGDTYENIERLANRRIKQKINEVFTKTHPGKTATTAAVNDSKQRDVAVTTTSIVTKATTATTTAATTLTSISGESTNSIGNACRSPVSPSPSKLHRRSNSSGSLVNEITNSLTGFEPSTATTGITSQSLDAGINEQLDSIRNPCDLNVLMLKQQQQQQRRSKSANKVDVAGGSGGGGRECSGGGGGRSGGGGGLNIPDFAIGLSSDLSALGDIDDNDLNDLNDDDDDDVRASMLASRKANGVAYGMEDDDDEEDGDEEDAVVDAATGGGGCGGAKKRGGGGGGGGGEVVVGGGGGAVGGMVRTGPDGEDKRQLEDDEDCFLEACVIYANWLNDPTSITESEKDAILDLIRKDWFMTSGRKMSTGSDVRQAITTMQNFGDLFVENVVNMVDNDGNTALHYAVSHANAPVIEVLLETGVCDVNKQNNAGYTCCMLAALLVDDIQRHRPLLKRLFDAGDINTPSVRSGQTALMLSSSHGREEMVSLLLDCGADINLQDEDGSTALMCASEHGHTDIIRILLAHPQCNSSISDIDGSTALSIAMEEGHQEIGVLIYAHVKAHGVIDEEEMNEEDAAITVDDDVGSAV